MAISDGRLIYDRFSDGIHKNSVGNLLIPGNRNKLCFFTPVPSIPSSSVDDGKLVYALERPCLVDWSGVYFNSPFSYGLSGPIGPWPTLHASFLDGAPALGQIANVQVGTFSPHEFTINVTGLSGNIDGLFYHGSGEDNLGTEYQFAVKSYFGGIGTHKVVDDRYDPVNPVWRWALVLLVDSYLAIYSRDGIPEPGWGSITFQQWWLTLQQWTDATWWYNDQYRPDLVRHAEFTTVFTADVKKGYGTEIPYTNATWRFAQDHLEIGNSMLYSLMTDGGSVLLHTH